MAETLDTTNRLLRTLGKSNIAIAFEKITVSSTAIPLTTIPPLANSALIIFESDATGIAMRYREDGGAPTATDGMARSHTEAVEILCIDNLKNFKVIQAQAGTHTIHVTYYK